MFCSLLEACANVQRTHKVHAFLLIERIPESFVRGDVCNLGRHRGMTSLGLASAISEFQTILSYKKSVSKEEKEETENRQAGRVHMLCMLLERKASCYGQVLSQEQG